MLDLLSEFFDNGRYWLRGNFHNDTGRRCLIDALRHLRARNAIVGDGTGFYLREGCCCTDRLRLPARARSAQAGTP